MRFLLRFIVCLLCLWLVRDTVPAAAVPLLQEMPELRPDSALVARKTALSFDSIARHHPMLAQKPLIYGIERPHVNRDRTADFYLLVFLCLLLGLIRLSNPRYFQALFRAFWNPTLSNRQLKEQLEHATIPNLLMNLFFAMTAGAYLFCIVRAFAPQGNSRLAPTLLLAALVSGVMLVYVAKYLMIRFSGWAFKIESMTDHYIFNVFLINKIVAVILVPFVVLLAFSGPTWVKPLIVVSAVLVGLLLLNRYTRSWQVFGSFFQYSRFHFFTYLCASEILPLAVLTKLLMQGLLY